MARSQGGDSNPPPPRAPARPAAPTAPTNNLRKREKREHSCGVPRPLCNRRPSAAAPRSHLPHTLRLRSRSALHGYPLGFWAPHRSAPSAGIFNMSMPRGSSGPYSHPAPKNIHPRRDRPSFEDWPRGPPLPYLLWEGPTGFSHPSVPQIPTANRSVTVERENIIIYLLTH